ncbi:MAG: protein kinase, partial [Pirellulales bacterium]
MISVETGHRSSQQFDVQICRALDAITTRLLNDPGADLKSLLDEYPQYAAQLRQLLPAMQAMAEVGRLSAGGAASSDQKEPASSDGNGGPAVAQGVLGDFRLLGEIGRGGMGIVYEAEQISLGRRVALKVLPFAAVLDERQLARFKNEARAAATLHHTNIVPVFSVGCEQGVHFYAMQFIAGHTLADVITQLRKNSKAATCPPVVGDELTAAFPSFPSSAWEHTRTEAPLREILSASPDADARSGASAIAGS